MDSNSLSHNIYIHSAAIGFPDDALIVVDLSNKIIIWSREAEKLFEYSAAEVIGRHLSFLVSPDKLERIVSIAHEIDIEVITELPGLMMTTKSGKHIKSDVLLSPARDRDGRVAGILMIARDLRKKSDIDSLLSKSNELIRLTFERATDYAIITFDAAATITTWSKGAELIFGYSEAEATGQHTSLIFTPEDIANGIDELELQTARVKGRAEDERWHIGKYGNRFFMSGVMISILNDDKTIIGYAKVARDITRRKMLEEQKDEFIKIASHELKTPVTTVKAFTEILLERFEKSEDRQSASMLQTMDGQVTRLTELIRTLLDTTALSTGNIPMKMEMADMNSIISEQIADLEKITKNHRLIYHPGNLRPVAIDKRLIEQVLINLISNAIKYSPAGSDIIISATENEKEIIVKVKDSGIGIPPAAISKIFDRYFRVLNTYTNSISGIGLGLYIVNSIINRHGGVISVQSKEGEGSVFQFTLPFKQVINFS